MFELRTEYGNVGYDAGVVYGDKTPVNMVLDFAGIMDERGGVHIANVAIRPPVLEDPIGAMVIFRDLFPALEPVEGEWPVMDDSRKASDSPDEIQ